MTTDKATPPPLPVRTLKFDRTLLFSMLAFGVTVAGIIWLRGDISPETMGRMTVAWLVAAVVPALIERKSKVPWAWYKLALATGGMFLATLVLTRGAVLQ